ncbi:hypothetical protein [Nocardia brasiliensis]|uniref:hypothetical protein n=1 Tax=Nocardia brasiliensis TaxID=37326 RepID=UPI003D8E16A5
MLRIPERERRTPRHRDHRPGPRTNSTTPVHRPATAPTVTVAYRASCMPTTAPGFAPLSNSAAAPANVLAPSAATQRNAVSPTTTVISYPATPNPATTGNLAAQSNTVATGTITSGHVRVFTTTAALGGTAVWDNAVSPTPTVISYSATTGNLAAQSNTVASDTMMRADVERPPALTDDESAACLLHDYLGIPRRAGNTRAGQCRYGAQV